MKQFGARTTCDQVVEGLDLSGQDILITGANSGIGFEAARSLAGAGAHVLAACRSEASGADAAARIRGRHRTARVTPVVLELGSFDSIQRCAASLPATKLDVLICNAGAVFSSYTPTRDGLESTVGIAHFGHFLLTRLLLERLRRRRRARVVMVSSESHRWPPTLDFARFPRTAQNYKSIVAYGQAKLCNVLFANELTRRYAHEGIFANSLHPGSFMGTQIFRDTKLVRCLASLAGPLTKSLEQGAATTVYCATSPELEGVGGSYYVDCQEKRPSKCARDEAAAARLWALSESVVPEITQLHEVVSSVPPPPDDSLM